MSFGSILSGVLPLAGAAIGGYYGGPQGAAAGAGAGSGVASMFSASDANAQSEAAVAQQENFNATQAGMARDWQRDEDQHAMDFAAEQSSTQYQRGVADMKAAGLNPMLAASQGGDAAMSGVSSGGSAGSSSAMPTIRPTVTPDTFSGVMANANSAADIGQKVSQAKLLSAQAANVDADTQLKQGDLANDYPTLKAHQTSASAYRDNSQGNLNQANESNVLANTAPGVDLVKAKANESAASAQQIESQNQAYKILMKDPRTAPYAAIIQLILNRGR